VLPTYITGPNPVNRPPANATLLAEQAVGPRLPARAAASRGQEEGQVRAEIVRCSRAPAARRLLSAAARDDDVRAPWSTAIGAGASGTNILTSCWFLASEAS